MPDEVHESEAFQFQDGTRITSLRGLLDKLDAISDAEFSHFVNPTKNDFASWIAHCFQHEALSKATARAKNRDTLIAVLDAYLINERPSPPKTVHREEYMPEQPQPVHHPAHHATHAPQHHAKHTAPKHQAYAPPAESSPEEEQQDEQQDTEQEEPRAPSPFDELTHKKPNITNLQTSAPKAKSAPVKSAPAKKVAPKKSIFKAPPFAPATPEPEAETPPEALPQESQQESQQEASDTMPPGVEPEEEGPHIDATLFSSEIHTDTPQFAPPTKQSQKQEHHKMHVDQEEILKEEHKPQEKHDGVLSEGHARHYSETMNRMATEIAKVFIGQHEAVKQVLLALMCDAHALLEGVPGLAKTLLVETLAKVIDGTTFNRIQFLPDLLPADVIGGQIYNPKTLSFTTMKGPIFANFVLADEINRAPPKTHAALMEAMQEKKINIDVEEFILDRPFLVIATQNPLENKGTYVLPEAVLDRFMFKIDLPYPSRKDEKIIITQNATTQANITSRVDFVMTKQEFLDMQHHIKDVYLSDRIKEYVLDLVEATRGLNPKIEGKQFIQYGGGPRASIYLGIAAKAHAVLEGRNYVLPEDIIYVAPIILRHRVVLNFRGKAHGISSDKIVEEILGKINAL